MRTNLPYEWPDPPDLLLAGLGQVALILVLMFALGNVLYGLVVLLLPGLWLPGLAQILLFGITLAVAFLGWRVLRQWTHDVVHDYESAGDNDVWPFLRRDDYEQACRETP